MRRGAGKPPPPRRSAAVASISARRPCCSRRRRGNCPLRVAGCRPVRLRPGARCPDCATPPCPPSPCLRRLGTHLAPRVVAAGKHGSVRKRCHAVPKAASDGNCARTSALRSPHPTRPPHRHRCAAVASAAPASAGGAVAARDGGAALAHGVAAPRPEGAFRRYGYHVVPAHSHCHERDRQSQAGVRTGRRWCEPALARVGRLDAAPLPGVFERLPWLRGVLAHWVSRRCPGGASRGYACTVAAVVRTHASQAVARACLSAAHGGAVGCASQPQPPHLGCGHCHQATRASGAHRGRKRLREH